jgi:hypothetical protein
MENLETEKDQMLWKEAKKRVGFKNHLMTYVVVNAMFWIVWYFTGKEADEGGLPWPIFPALGWGFGLFMHFSGTYLMGNKASQVEREFAKLKKKSENK